MPSWSLARPEAIGGGHHQPAGVPRVDDRLYGAQAMTRFEEVALNVTWRDRYSQRKGAGRGGRRPGRRGTERCHSVGLSAVTLGISAYLSAGDHVLVTDSVYGHPRFCDEVGAYGIENGYFDPCIVAGPEARAPSMRMVRKRGS